jgi:hypothetical protein
VLEQLVRLKVGAVGSLAQQCRRMKVFILLMNDLSGI